MKKLISSYTFNAIAGTITFPTYTTLDLKRFLIITNVRANTIIYNFADTTKGGTVTGNVLTLVYNTTAMNNTDDLQVFYEFDTPIATTLPQGTETSMLTRSVPAVVDRISFAKALSGSVDSDWGTLKQTGSGMAVNQTGGNLVITSGTTANAETIIRSNNSYAGGLRLRAKTILSQRIANNNFFVELVDVIQDAASVTINSATSVTVTFTTNPFTSVNVGQYMYLGGYSGTGTFVPGRYAIASVSGSTVTYTVAGFAVGSGTCSVFGWNYYHLVYDGTTATNAKFDTQRRGYNTGDTTVTINTTASPGHLAMMTANDMSAVLYDQLVASSTAVRSTARASRDENVPDDASALYLQIRVANGSTAPASTTTWTVGYVAVSNYSGQDVVVQDTRMTTNAPTPVDILRSVATTTTVSSITAGTNAIGDVGVQYRANATGAATAVSILSPATNAAASVKASAGRLIGWYLQNSATAVRSVKIYNATSVTLGTTAAAFEIDIPAGGFAEVNLLGGIAMSTGIMWACTAGKGLTDNTGGVTANDVSGVVFYV